MTDSFFCAPAQLTLEIAEKSTLTKVSYIELHTGLKKFIERAAQKRRWMNDSIDLEDLKQVGYIALWKAHESFDPPKGVPIEHYARRAVVNEMIKVCFRCADKLENLYNDYMADDMQTEDLYDQMLEDESAEGYPDPVFHEFASKEILETLQNSDVPFTSAQRKVFELIYVEGKTVQGVTQILKISKQAIGQHHSKAIQVCRNHLGISMQ